MNLYITLQEGTNHKEQINKLEKGIQPALYKILGSYESRGYTTIVIKLDRLIEANEIEMIEDNLKHQMSLLEITPYMKFYYVLKGGHKSCEVNQKVRMLFKQEGYVAKTYNSHSENGRMYIGLKIMDIDPSDEYEMQKIKGIISEIKEIEELQIY